MKIRSILDRQEYAILPTLEDEQIPEPSAEMMEFPCPDCRRVIRCDHLLGGQQGRCQRCGATFKVPIRRLDPLGPPAAAGELPPFVQVQIVRPVECGFKLGIGIVLAAASLGPVALVTLALGWAILQSTFGN